MSTPNKPELIIVEKRPIAYNLHVKANSNGDDIFLTLRNELLSWKLEWQGNHSLATIAEMIIAIFIDEELNVDTIKISMKKFFPKNDLVFSKNDFATAESILEFFTLNISVTPE